MGGRENPEGAAAAISRRFSKAEEAPLEQLGRDAAHSYPSSPSSGYRPDERGHPVCAGIEAGVGIATRTGSIRQVNSPPGFVVNVLEPPRYVGVLVAESR